MPYTTETEYPRVTKHAQLGDAGVLTVSTTGCKLSGWHVYNVSATPFTLTFRRPGAGATYFVDRYLTVLSGNHDIPLSCDFPDGLEILATGVTGLAYVTAHITG